MALILLQLNRLGDIAQTVPVAGALALENPTETVMLVIPLFYQTLFADWVLPFRIVPIAPIDQNALNTLDVSNSEIVNAWLKKYPDLAGEHEFLANLGHSHDSAILSHIISGRRKLGRLHAPKGELRASGRGARYLYALVRHRTRNLFNLVDLNALSAGLLPHQLKWKAQIPLAVKERGNALLNPSHPMGSLPNPEKRKWVALQMGASDFFRAYDPEALALVANQLSQKGFEIVLLGDSREKTRAELFKKVFSGTCLDLVGRTNLTELPGILSGLELLITGDTGTAHIAALCETPMVNLFFATAFLTETAPYSNAQWILQTELECSPCKGDAPCAKQICRDVLSPIIVAEVALFALGVTSIFPILPKDLRCYRPRHLADGSLLHEPVDGKPYSRKYQNAVSCRKVWSPFLGLDVEALPASLKPSIKNEIEGGEKSAGLVHITVLHDAVMALQTAILMAQRLIDNWGKADFGFTQIEIAHAQLSVGLGRVESIMNEIPMVAEYVEMVWMDLEQAQYPNLAKQIVSILEEIRDLIYSFQAAQADFEWLGESA